jgi:hypothetical protein
VGTVLLDDGITRKYFVVVECCPDLQGPMRLFFSEGLGTRCAALVKVGGK